MMTFKNKILAILLAVNFNAFAAAWTGTSVEPASTKTIDGKKFYVISNPDELAWFAIQVNNGNSEINAVLKNDIIFGNDTSASCGHSWMPIGNDEKIFNGIFDGAKHTIYGLCAMNASSNKGEFFRGFIGYSGPSSIVKNLNLKNFDISKIEGNYIQYGGIVAYNQGLVEHCNNYGDVAVQNFAGGIVGYNKGIIRYCNNYGNVGAEIYKISESRNSKTSASSTAGGIAGHNEGSIEKCINYGSVKSLASVKAKGVYAKAISTAMAGGIAGNGDGVIRYCINTVEVNALANASADTVLKNKIERELGLNAVSSYAVPVNVDASMQNDLYAYKLNTNNGTEENSGVWSRYDGYPVFANDTLHAICKITFDDGENTYNFYTNYRGNSAFPSPPIPAEGKAFAGWFNSDGKEINLTTIFLKDQTVTAKFLNWEDVVYSIRFLDEKGNVLDLQSVHSGEIPVYGGSEPTKKATVAYTYAFAGWSPEITAAIWHTDYRVLFDSTLNQYKVTYLDYDGTELYSAMFDYGKKPSYSTIPKREKTVAYIYAFAGWSPTVETVSGETTYKAVYDSTLQKYAIQFMNGKESLLSKDVEYGTVPKYDGNAPTKPATKEYSYSFVGWTPEISKVTEATSYTAKFDSSLNKYMVVFQNGAKMLQDTEIEYGKVPAYKGETPQKTSTAKYDYSFSSWSPALTKVTDEATYTALFDSTIRSYEIAFVSEGKTLQAKEVEYGALPKFEGKEPSKSESKGYTYSFKRWNPSIAMVKEKATYIAVFDSVAKKFIVTFMNGKDTLQSSSVAYGKNPEYKGKTPTKSSSSKYEYKFAGWSPKLTTVTEKVVYKAVFDSTAKSGLMTSRNFAKNFAVSVWGTQIQIANAKIGSSYALFDLQGHIVVKGVVKQKSFVINAKNRGRYILRIGLESKPVVVK